MRLASQFDLAVSVDPQNRVATDSGIVQLLEVDFALGHKIQ
jgi:hypothetical protein